MIINFTPQRSWVDTILQGCYEQPIFTFRPNALAAAVHCFQQNFKAEILYAVKANPSAHVLRGLIQNGISAFDVASIEEIRLVHSMLPSAQMYFMHPIKSRAAIRLAYFEYGVRHFSIDSQAELEKILDETDHARDLTIHIRLAIPNLFSELSLAEKFGIDTHNAPDLLVSAAKVAEKVGVCFHVGSQCMHPDAYCIAIGMASTVIEQAEIPVHYFNVGGGFPSIYPGMHPPQLMDYFERIHEKLNEIPNYQTMQLLAEPGRALVAESGALIVRVMLRKQNTLYINSGTYGALFDAGTPKFIFPAKLLRSYKTNEEVEMQAFDFYGPTCDALDYMPGPFYLPADTAEGDFIEIGQLGAYSCTLTTRFNGFTHGEEIIEIAEPPLMSLYIDISSNQTELQLTTA